MVYVPFGKRLKIAAIGYSLVLISTVVLWAISRFSGLSSTERIIFSVAAVAPILISLVWERIQGLNFVEVEVTPMASAIQELQGLGTPTLVQAITAAINSKELKLVEINLRDGTNWWSTRLYLLSALAEEYTSIEGQVFVEQNAARQYLGMASPSAVRKALARRFLGLEREFRELRAISRQFPADPGSQVMDIGSNWQTRMFRPIDQDANVYVPETQVRDFVNSREGRRMAGKSIGDRFSGVEWGRESFRNIHHAYVFSSEPEPGCSSTSGAPAFAPDMPPCNPSTVIWQYAEDCLDGRVDEDLATDAGLASMW